jgi:hypothetical protein
VTNVQYRDPASGATWSGRGRAPQWIANAKDRARFRIEGGPGVAEAGKGKPVGNYPRGPQPAKYRDPKSGATWSGRGRAPAWLSDVKDRTAFLLAGAADGVSSAGATPAKKAVARKAVGKKAATAKAAPKTAVAKKVASKKVARKGAVRKSATRETVVGESKTVARKALGAKAVAKKSAKPVTTKKVAPTKRAKGKRIASEATVVDNSATSTPSHSVAETVTAYTTA